MFKLVILIIYSIKISIKKGEVAERLKAHAWKACKGATLSRVRIPLSPPTKNQYLQPLFDQFCH